jgi:uncharacterized membrane protein
LEPKNIFGLYGGELGLLFMFTGIGARILLITSRKISLNCDFGAVLFWLCVKVNTSMCCGKVTSWYVCCVTGKLFCNYFSDS